MLVITHFALYNFVYQYQFVALVFVGLFQENTDSEEYFGDFESVLYLGIIWHECEMFVCLCCLYYMYCIFYAFYGRKYTSDKKVF